MSGFLGADPEQLDRLARSFTARADDLRATAKALTVVVAQVRWVGPGAVAFTTEWRTRSAPSLLAAAELLETLAEQMRRRRFEQEQVSGVPGSEGGPASGTPGYHHGLPGTGGLVGGPLWSPGDPPFHGWTPMPWPWVPQLPVDGPAPGAQPLDPGGLPPPGPPVGPDGTVVPSPVGRPAETGPQPAETVQPAAERAPVPGATAADEGVREGAASPQPLDAQTRASTVDPAPAATGSPHGSPTSTDPGPAAAVPESGAVAQQAVAAPSPPPPGSPAAVAGEVGRNGPHPGFVAASVGGILLAGAAAGAGVVAWRAKHRQAGEYLDEPMVQRMGLDSLAQSRPTSRPSVEVGAGAGTGPVVVKRAEGWSALQAPPESQP